MKILETERLIIRELDASTDGEFINDLLNQPSFIRYIGDRGVRSAAEASDFIENRYRQSYRDHGYGLYAVDMKEDAELNSESIRNPKSKIQNRAIGICGFVRRVGLEHPDIGFAFLPQYEGRGYAFESASAVLEYGRETLGIERPMAITTFDNENSVKLLGKLGFVFRESVVLPGSDEELNLFVKE
ncbi:MAG: GNAT family N-acetyltransferase [Acidobacteria bacterium]|nr:GNAT family N-acetyltransferase [Acidobacteriota bacterium]